MSVTGTMKGRVDTAVHLLSEVMRPAERRINGTAPGDCPMVAQWPHPHRVSGPARRGAASIALVLRERLRLPGKTAALVTADRALARRVAAELQRWDISRR